MTKIEFVETQVKSVTLDSSDPVFRYSDGLAIYTRAAISINPACPERLADVVQYCIKMGWVKPVANMRLTEYVAAKLEQN